jgi:hypothetical protein
MRRKCEKENSFHAAIFSPCLAAAWQTAWKRTIRNKALRRSSLIVKNVPHFPFTSSVCFLLTEILLTMVNSSVCFFPDTITRGNYFGGMYEYVPCNPSAPNSACCVLGDTCVGNGLCYRCVRLVSVGNRDCLRLLK